MARRSAGVPQRKGRFRPRHDEGDWARWFTASYRGIHVHHLVYRSRGGSGHLSNLNVIHAQCHRQLHAGGRRKEPK
ncbi:HNH endonuclease [Streptomyces hygroscopicus]|uniref:HNH endonuclease n=1 Tax=Streptomyces hygroscopicus TaxID=1912 RepID=UPI00340363DF